MTKPTLESLAAEMRRLQERIEDIEDLIELRSAIERNTGKPGVLWEQVKGVGPWLSRWRTTDHTDR